MGGGRGVTSCIRRSDSLTLRLAHTRVNAPFNSVELVSCVSTIPAGARRRVRSICRFTTFIQISTSSIGWLRCVALVTTAFITRQTDTNRPRSSGNELSSGRLREADRSSMGETSSYRKPDRTTKYTRSQACPAGVSSPARGIGASRGTARRSDAAARICSKHGPYANTNLRVSPAPAYSGDRYLSSCTTSSSGDRCRQPNRSRSGTSGSASTCPTHSQATGRTCAGNPTRSRRNSSR